MSTATEVPSIAVISLRRRNGVYRSRIIIVLGSRARTDLGCGGRARVGRRPASKSGAVGECRSETRRRTSTRSAAPPPVSHHVTIVGPESRTDGVNNNIISFRRRKTTTTADDDAQLLLLLLPPPSPLCGVYADGRVCRETVPRVRTFL